MDELPTEATSRVDVPAREPLDVLGATSVTIDRLRRFLADPPTAAQEARHSNWVNGLTSRTSKT